jgi:hypothetical protein
MLYEALVKLPNAPIMYARDTYRENFISRVNGLIENYSGTLNNLRMFPPDVNPRTMEVKDIGWVIIWIDGVLTKPYMSVKAEYIYHTIISF